MGKIKNCFLVAIFFLFLLDLGFCQTVILKTGQKVEGKIIEQTDKYVKLEFQGVELTFYDDEISSIEQTSLDGAKTMTPQMELLYKAYSSAVNSRKTPAKEPVAAVKKPAEEAAQQALQEGLSAAQPVFTGQGSMPANFPVDLSVLPLEYQEKIKSSLAQLQAGKTLPVEDSK